MTSEPATLYCENHPNTETTLRCNRCEKPICTKCAVLTETGYRCTECVRSQQKIFNTATTVDYILAVGIAVILAYIGSLISSRIGFFTIFVAPIAGIVIAEAIRRAIRRRRSKRLFQATAAATAVGGILPVLSVLALTGLTIGISGIFFFIWPVVYTVIVTSTVYYRLAGISL
ncbi:MAG: B-box zinc finger protein [Anaerolineales bacterium]